MKKESEVQAIVRSMEEERDRIMETAVSDESQLPPIAKQLEMLTVQGLRSVMRY
jgi:predicted AAA+ superfamily ATPase